MRFLIFLALAMAVPAPQTPRKGCQCIPINTTHLVGVGQSQDTQGRTFTAYVYGCDLGGGERQFEIACITQTSGQTSCACKRDGVTLRSVRSLRPFSDADHAIAACRFPS